jgi:hypothetical protein
LAAVEQENVRLRHENRELRHKYEQQLEAHIGELQTVTDTFSTAHRAINQAEALIKDFRWSEREHLEVVEENHRLHMRNRATEMERDIIADELEGLKEMLAERWLEVIEEESEQVGYV